MKIVTGNLWDYIDTHWITITTNNGWNKHGRNVMGRGIAKQAADRYPDLPEIYGRVCQANPNGTNVFPIQFHEPLGRLIMFPTKELNEAAPWFSWRYKSSIELISKCIPVFKLVVSSMMGPVVFPPFGCGNGGLNLKEMTSRIEEWFSDDKHDIYTLVLPKEKTEADKLPF